MQVFSNGHSEKARALLDKVRLELDCSIFKTSGKRPRGWVAKRSIAVAPRHVRLPEDAGIPSPATAISTRPKSAASDSTRTDSRSAQRVSRSALSSANPGRLPHQAPRRHLRPSVGRASDEEMCKHCGYAMNQRGTHDSRQAFADYLEKQPTGQAAHVADVAEGVRGGR